MELITRYQNYRTLSKMLDNPELLTKRVYSIITTNINIFEEYRNFKKGGIERTLIYKVIKLGRSKFPYKIKGWDDNKKEYNKYFTIKNHIPSMSDIKSRLDTERVFVTHINNKSYYNNPDNLFEYNESVSVSNKSTGGVYEVKKFNEEGNYFSLHNTSRLWIENSSMQMFRYATEDEIINHKNMMKDIDKLKDDINNLSNEISDKKELIYELEKNGNFIR